MTAKLVVPEAIQLTEIAGDPATVAGKVQVYGKDSGGTTKLFMQDGAGTVTEVGSGGGGIYSPAETWTQIDIAASQTNVALSTQVSQEFDTIKMTRSGSIVGLSTRLTEAVTAGTLTVEVTINGSPTSLTLAHTSGTGSQFTQAAGIDSYVAGDLVGIRITTDAGFLPNTTDLEAYIQLFEGIPAASGGAGVVVGDPVTGGTDGGLLFQATGPLLAQDASNLFWDDTNNRLGLGTNVPGTVLDIAGTGNTAGLALRGGSSTVVSAAGSARIRFNEGTNTLQASLNGGAYSDIGGVSNPTWLTVGDRATHALDTPVKVVSAFEFDRSQFTSSTIKFRATGARGNTVNGVVELYNLTDAASVTTLTFSSTSPALQESADITGSLPASSKIYEVRIYLAAPFIAGDSIELYSAYLNLAP